MKSSVVGQGLYLPKKVLTNKDLEQTVETSDAWIVKRTGIKQRHIAAEGELTSDLAANAGKQALKSAGLTADDVDMVLVATSTPDLTFPATATIVQTKLGIHQGFAFDLNAVCSGFLYAMATADNFIKAGQVKTVLVIGAEVFSRVVDWSDRATCVLFGDGAGAMVLQATKGEEGGIISTHLYSDGRYADLLKTDGGVGTTKTAGVVEMQGKEVFKHAVSKMAEAVEVCLKSNNLTAAEIDWMVPHQANKRIIDGMGQKLSLSDNSVVVTVDNHANTSAASIPLAYATAVADGRIQPGHLVLFEALGAGFTWASALLRV